MTNAQSQLRIASSNMRSDIFLGLLLIFLLAYSNPAFATESELRKAASWQWPPITKLETKLKTYLDENPKTLEPRSAIEEHWSLSKNMQPGPQLFEHVLSTLAKLDDRFNRVISQLDRRTSPGLDAPIDVSWLDESIAPWIRANVQLAVARSLAHQQLYDEAVQILKALDLTEVADPSTLLFYRAVCYHHLLQKEECIVALNQLMERDSELATRYAVTSRLMKSDIEPLKEDSLDEISRLMNDVQRRLDLGRSGKVVRDQEQQIVDKLDKMIDKIEQQIQEQQKKQQQQQQSKDEQKKGQSKPMDDSRNAENSGQGDVDPKNVGKRNGWGDLPPAQRQEALQNITKDLPSHYREIIEAYFKALATENP
jgi:ribosome-associated translation inhibitor RaiA